MIEIQQEQERKVKCLLVGAPDKKNGNLETSSVKQDPGLKALVESVLK